MNPTVKFRKISYVKDLRNHLQSDIKSYVYGCTLLQEKVDSFTILRIITPYIEVASKMIYHQYGKKSTSKFIEKLGINTPYIAWVMFRHGILHNNYPNCFISNKVSISWSLNVGTSSVKDNEKTTVKISHGDIIRYEVLGKTYYLDLDVGELYHRVIKLLRENETTTIKLPRTSWQPRESKKKSFEREIEFIKANCQCDNSTPDPKRKK